MLNMIHKIGSGLNSRDSLANLNNYEIRHILSSIVNLILEINDQGLVERIIPTGYCFSFFQPNFLLGKSFEYFINHSDRILFCQKLKNVLTKGCQETLEISYDHKE